MGSEATDVKCAKALYVWSFFEDNFESIRFVKKWKKHYTRGCFLILEKQSFQILEFLKMATPVMVFSLFGWIRILDWIMVYPSVVVMPVSFFFVRWCCSRSLFVLNKVKFCIPLFVLPQISSGFIFCTHIYIYIYIIILYIYIYRYIYNIF